ncbi:hypothetical protein [Nostoc sp. CHAB 5715]|uniref:hypothetical protein n=1 Tax=Nostoc sp. CHAB 5715 TaxID=2780400 RepID=UPI001E2C832D|nr:hypothetical protein [Nostoc sp. CHAB 5715]MCC5624458.1 hypothetical protein [Nostoc sp. CHAB 5715]
MTTQYFAQANTVEAIKTLYRNLALENHPDRGGDEDIMKEINRQYHEALKRCEGQASHTTPDGEQKTYTYKGDVETELMEKLLELLKLRSLEIALIGYWIWVSGDTKPNREALKAAGLQWHSERKVWYYKPLGWKKSKKSKGSLGELAKKYGYQGYQTAAEEKMPTTT